MGGSIQSLGTTFMGAGIVPSLTSVEAAEQLKWLVISGFVLKAIGEQITAFFAADANVVAANLNEQREINRGTEVFLNPSVKP